MVVLSTAILRFCEQEHGSWAWHVDVGRGYIGSLTARNVTIRDASMTSCSERKLDDDQSR